MADQTNPITHRVQQVTRYVLIREALYKGAISERDLAEFKRRDDAESVMNALNDWQTAYDKKFNSSELDTCIRINGDIAITLSGLDALDTAAALDLLEARVANAQRAWQNLLKERQTASNREQAERLAKIRQSNANSISAINRPSRIS